MAGSTPSLYVPIDICMHIKLHNTLLLQVFSDNTKPVLDFYADKGILQEFQGTESKKIWPHVEKFLKERFA